jgi:cysteine synthase
VPEISQSSSQSNVQVHYEETAEEILAQTEEQLDVLVVGVESGGTCTTWI